MTTKTAAKPPRKRATKKAAANIDNPAPGHVDPAEQALDEGEDNLPDPAQEDLFGEPVEEVSEADRNALLKKGYSNATSRLREENREEFDRLYVEEAKKLGVVYTPKPSAEQKAKQDIEDLLAKFPHLRDQLVNGEPVVNPAPAEIPDPA